MTGKSDRAGGAARGSVRRWIQAWGVAGILCASSAHAYVTCTGNITYLGLSTVGRVTVNNGYGAWFICDLGATYGGYTADACKGIYAGLLAARAAEAPVSFYFNDGAVCSALGDFVLPNPTPYYFKTFS